MSYLSRDAAPFEEGLWNKIDKAIIETARKSLTGRKFLHIYGPLGVGINNIPIDSIADIEEESTEDGFMITKGRKFVEIPTIYDDFTLFARDIEHSMVTGLPLDLSNASLSAERCARKEDHFIFFGQKEYGYEGLLTAEGVNKIKREDWSEGELAYKNIVSAIEIFTSNGIYGNYSLIMSPDLYIQLNRIQPGTGLLEIDRIQKLMSNRVFHTTILGKGKALLVCSDERYMDLVIGQDMAGAYLEQKDLNHVIRIVENVLLRIKLKQAVTIFE